MGTLKNTFVSHPVMKHSYSGGHMTVDTVACNLQIFCVSLQLQPDNRTEPFGYCSHSLTDTEQQFDTTQQKCLAIASSISLLRLYLEGQLFQIQTDYYVLRWILNLDDFTGRLACWRLLLLEFDFDIIHCSGMNYQATDALLQISTTVEDKIIAWGRSFASGGKLCRDCKHFRCTFTRYRPSNYKRWQHQSKH